MKGGVVKAGAVNKARVGSDALWRRVETEVAQRGVAEAERAATRLADTLACDVPDITVTRTGAALQIRGRNLHARQANDARLRWIAGLLR